MSELRLGDVIDDYCIKCKRLTNHAIVSMMGAEVAKVRCRSCYHEHNFLHEQIPPSKKDLKKLELFNAVLASADPSAATSAAIVAGSETAVEEAATPIDGATPAAPAAKKTRGRAKKA